MREIFQNSFLVENVDMASSFPYAVFLKQYFRNSFKAFTPKQLLFFFKQSVRVFLFWKLSSIRIKRFHLLEICWKTRWQKFRSFETHFKIFGTLRCWLFGHRDNNNGMHSRVIMRYVQSAPEKWESSKANIFVCWTALFGERPGLKLDFDIS